MSKRHHGRLVPTGQNTNSNTCTSGLPPVPIYGRCHGMRHDYLGSCPTLPAGWNQKGKRNKYTNTNFAGVIARPQNGKVRLLKRTTGRTAPNPSVLDAAANHILGGQPAPDRTVMGAPAYHIEVDVPASWMPMGHVRRHVILRKLVVVHGQDAELRLSASKAPGYVHFAAEAFWAEHKMGGGKLRRRLHVDDLHRIPADAGIAATEALLEELLKFIDTLIAQGCSISSKPRADLPQVGTVDVVGGQRTITLDPSMISACLPYGPFSIRTVL